MRALFTICLLFIIVYPNSISAQFTKEDSVKIAEDGLKVNNLFHIINTHSKGNLNLAATYKQNLFINTEIFINFSCVGCWYEEKGPILGLEIASVDNNTIVAPKIGVLYDIVFLETKVSALYYFYNGRRSFKLRPELGIRINRTFSLNYGYNIAIGRTFLNEGNHCFSLMVRVPLNEKYYRAYRPKYSHGRHTILEYPYNINIPKKKSF